MAKLGKGDARWIVQEREDGTNVHGWHWSEKDVLKWSQTRLSELLGNKNLLEGEAQTFVSTTTVDSVTGEALINNRKKKLIPSYELAVKGQWQGHIADGDGNKATTATGTFQLPYISDENADEDPELTVALTEEGSGQQRLKQAFVTKGKKVLKRDVLIYTPASGTRSSATCRLPIFLSTWPQLPPCPQSFPKYNSASLPSLCLESANSFRTHVRADTAHAALLAQKQEEIQNDTRE